ncbi:helix-turn-helix domain-containing protein [Gaopeijia maritima]|uniref:Helix-turn-helix transcriptional regulator n=1 Tax=Gaopeijia maritima TaxID=3119007 RepID=A0ABU9EAE6_9BACT
MDDKTKKRLVAAGWSTGDARDFLELSDSEAEFIEMKLALAQDLRARRRLRHLNQTQVARIVGSSQSRVAKMEAADPSVSLDLLVKTLLKLGVARAELAETLSQGPKSVVG